MVSEWGSGGGGAEGAAAPKSTESIYAALVFDLLPRHRPATLAVGAVGQETKEFLEMRQRQR